MFILRTIVWGIFFQVIALLLGPWLAMQFDASFPLLALGVYKYAGLVLLAIGIPLMLYCGAVLFIPGKSRPAPYDAGGAFTIAGPYCYVRNPFMLGVILSLWGEAIFLSSIVTIIYAAIVTWCIHVWVVFFEEPSLQQRFGREYRTYRSSVPRWFPQFRKFQSHD